MCLKRWQNMFASYTCRFCVENLSMAKIKPCFHKGFWFLYCSTGHSKHSQFSVFIFSLIWLLVIVFRPVWFHCSIFDVWTTNFLQSSSEESLDIALAWNLKTSGQPNQSTATEKTASLPGKRPRSSTQTGTDSSVGVVRLQRSGSGPRGQRTRGRLQKVCHRDKRNSVQILLNHLLVFSCNTSL